MDKNQDIFDGFTVSLFLDEYGDYLAHFVELPSVSRGKKWAQSLDNQSS